MQDDAGDAIHEAFVIEEAPHADSPHADSPFAYRPDIDGLRAVAVLAVVIYHLNRSLLPGGFTGVDVFFVISGYVVSGSLLKKASPSRTDYFVGFYSRRVKRITPALLVTVLVTGFALAILIPPQTPALDGYYLSGMLALVGGANMRYALLSDSGSYFDDGNGPNSLQLNPFTHTWSLGVEEQFYFLFPLFLFATHGVHVVTNASTRPAWASPLAALGIAAVLSALLSLVATIKFEQLAFYTLPSRFWELALGGAALQARISIPFAEFLVNRRLALAMMELLAVSLIVCAFVFTSDKSSFPFPGAVVAVSGALCFIVAGSCPGALVNRYLSHWLPVYIGKLSYSIYLWHWPVLVMLKWALGKDTMTLATGLLGALLLSIGLAAATYHFVEGPFRHWHPKRQWMALAVLLPALLCAELGLHALRGPFAGSFYFGDDDSDKPEPPQLFRSDCQCSYDARNGAFHIPPGARTGDNATGLAPCFSEVVGWHGGFPWDQAPFNDDCFLGPSTRHPAPLPANWQTIIEACLKPKATRRPGERVIFLIGDSHAVHVLPTFQMIVNGTNSSSKNGTDSRDSDGNHFFSIRLLASICGFAPKSAEEAYGPTKGLWDKMCHDFHDENMAQLESALQPGDIVAVSNIATKLRPGAPIDDFAHLLVDAHRFINASNATLIVLEDSPFLPASGVSCVPTSLNPDAPALCEQDKVVAERYVAPVHSMLTQLTLEYPDIIYVGYHHLFCDNDKCGAMIPGTKTLGIFDMHHMTEYGARYLAPFLCAYMSEHRLFE